MATNGRCPSRPPTKCECKKVVAESFPIKISVPLEEWMDEPIPLSFQSQTLDKEDILVM